MRHVVHRLHVRAAHIDCNEVSLETFFEQSAILSSLRQSSGSRGAEEYLLRCHGGRVHGFNLAGQGKELNLLDKIQAVVACDAVCSECNVDAFLVHRQFRLRV